MEYMYKELECPICTEYLLAPIFQCQRGHSFCRKCYPKMQDCPICKGNMSDIRNYVLENLSATMFVSCTNASKGCEALVPKMKKDEHESQCEFGRIYCEFPGCDWWGTSELELENHWASKPLKEEIYNLSHNCNISIPSHPFSVFVNLFKAHDKLFWFKYQLDDEGLMEWSLRLIGEESDKFTYYFEIEFLSDSKRKIVLSDYCSNEEGVFEGINGASIPLSMLNKFIIEDKLSYKVTIHFMEKEIKESSDEEEDDDIESFEVIQNQGLRNNRGRGRGRGRGRRRGQNQNQHQQQHERSYSQPRQPRQQQNHNQRRRRPRYQQQEERRENPECVIS